MCVCVCAHAVHALFICFSRPRFLPVEEASLSTCSHHTGDQLSPSQHQTRFKCVEKSKSDLWGKREKVGKKEEGI